MIRRGQRAEPAAIEHVAADDGEFVAAETDDEVDLPRLALQHAGDMGQHMSPAA
jgi:hypothetical protein